MSIEYIILNEQDYNRFNELKIESGIDFSTVDVQFIKYYNNWILPSSLMEAEEYAQFKQYLSDNDHLNNLQKIQITNQELETYWMI